LGNKQSKAVDNERFDVGIGDMNFCADIGRSVVARKDDVLDVSSLLEAKKTENYRLRAWKRHERRQRNSQMSRRDLASPTIDVLSE
jgi:hypothetical protein